MGKRKCIDFPEAQTNISAVTLQDTMGSNTPVVNYDWEVLQSTDITISTIKTLLLSQDNYDKDEHSTEMKSFSKYYDDLVIENNLLYLDGKEGKRLVVPQAQQKQLTTIYHNFGHFGITRVYKLLKEKLFWPGMMNTITKVISQCSRCLKSKTPKEKNKGPLGHIESPPIPMHQLSMDFLTIDTRAQSKFKILTVVCEFTKYAFAFVVKSEKASKTADTLYRNLYTKFGLPKVIHTDRGATFLSKVISELNKMLTIKHTTTVPYRPQSNASCERLNSTIIQRIRTLAPAEKPRWHTHVDSLLFAYNSTVHESTGISPFYAMFGRHPTLPTDLLVQLPDSQVKQQDVKSYARQRNTELQESFKLCVENMRKRRERNKRNFDAKITRNPTLKFFPNDKVLITKHLTRNKIDDHYSDEIFEVIEQKGNSLIYMVRGLDTAAIKSVHRDDIILFKEASSDKDTELVTWQEMKYIPDKLDTEVEEYKVDTKINNKIVIWYGNIEELHITHSFQISSRVTQEKIAQKLQSMEEQGASKIAIVIERKISRSEIKCILLMVRRELKQKGMHTIIIVTHQHSTYNIIMNYMNSVFPKVKASRVQDQSVHYDASASDTSDCTEIFIPRIIDQQISPETDNSTPNPSSDEESSNSSDNASSAHHGYNLRHHRQPPDWYGISAES